VLLHLLATARTRALRTSRAVRTHGLGNRTARGDTVDVRPDAARDVLEDFDIC
jgi:hypothetical protein